jgi:hypothetical protein
LLTVFKDMMPLVAFLNEPLLARGRAPRHR